MRTSPSPLSTISLALLISLPAHADSDWDWSTELQDRHWRESSLQWASNIHPDSPSPLVLMSTTSPPAEELWCDYTSAPTIEDCDIFDDLLDSWVRDYLDIPEQDPVPLSLTSSFPRECSSTCQ